MRTARTVILALAAAMLMAGCDSGGREGDEYEPTIDQAEEQAGCDAIPGGTTGSFLSASATIADAKTLAAGGKRIELTDFEGDNGGYVKVSLIGEAGTQGLLLLVEEDMPVEVLDADGASQELIADGSTSNVCDVNTRILWLQEGENYLRLGPTSIADAHISITVID